MADTHAVGEPIVMSFPSMSILTTIGLLLDGRPWFYTPNRNRARENGAGLEDELSEGKPPTPPLIPALCYFYLGSLTSGAARR